MNPLDNVERRDSDPHAHARLVAPDHDTCDLYNMHLNAVCHAIRSTPTALVDKEFVVHVLNVLANRAANNSHDVAEALDILADSLS